MKPALTTPVSPMPRASQEKLNSLPDSRTTSV